MPRYDYRCPSHGVFEAIHRMSDAALTHCPACKAEVTRVFHVPHFTEDRRRLWRNKDGTRWHPQLGMERPDSRGEEEAVLKARGQEMVPWSETPAHFRRAKEYGEHLLAGGEQLPPDEVAAIVNEPKEPEPSIEQQLDAIGYSRERGLSREQPPAEVLLDSFMRETV